MTCSSIGYFWAITPDMLELLNIPVLVFVVYMIVFYNQVRNCLLRCLQPLSFSSSSAPSVVYMIVFYNQVCAWLLMMLISCPTAFSLSSVCPPVVGLFLWW